MATLKDRLIYLEISKNTKISGIRNHNENQTEYRFNLMTLGIYNLLIIIIFHRRDRFIATTIEWFHLLIDIANEDTIRSKLKSLNKNLFQQVISRAKIKTDT